MFAIDTGNPNDPQGRARHETRQQTRGDARQQPRGQAKRDSFGQERREGDARQAGAQANPAVVAVKVLRRHFVSILALSLLGLLLGVGLALLTPDRFAATTQMLIDPRDLRILQNELSPQTTSNDAAVAYLESQARVIASDGIKRKVIERLSLAGDPDFGGPGTGLAQRFGLAGSLARDARDPVLVALAAMDKQIFVRRSERTYVIDITSITGDGGKSARVANMMAEVYLEDQAAVRSETAQRTSNALTGRLSELRERVRLAEDKVEKYRAANNLVGTGGKLVTEDTLSVSNTQLSQARARTLDAQAKYDQARAVRPSSVEAGATPEALQSPAIAGFRAQLGAALTREADALVLYGAQHPQLLSAQAQVRDARRQIAEELARTVQASRAELDRARAAETAIGQQVERLKRETLSTGQAAVQLRELEREADANRQVYQAFLLRARETGEQTSVDTTNARIITSATAPLEKLGPNRKLYAVLGLMGGLGLGISLAAARSLFGGQQPAMANGGPQPAPHPPSPADRMPEPASGLQSRQPGDAPPTRSAGTRNVVVPLQQGEAGLAQKTANARWRAFGASQQAAPQAPASSAMLTVQLPAAKGGRWRTQPRLETSAFHGTALLTDAWDDPRSVLGAAIMQVRDRLVVQESAGANRKVAVLGLSPGAGASLVALNLALASAREKATPVLIDLASGPASLSASFAADAELGAEDVISGAAGLIRAALQDDETGTFFLPRPADFQRRPTPSADRLASGLFEQTRRFDSVIIDAGAITDGALPHLLAELADDIVVVAPAAMDQGAARRLIQRSLGPEAAKVRVLVVNGLPSAD